MIVAFSVAPAETGRADASVHEAVATAVQIVRESGLPCRTSAMFTELEGEWDEVFKVVKQATEAVTAYGSRVSLVLKADIRPGYTHELDGKLERLEKAIATKQTTEATATIANKTAKTPATTSQNTQTPTPIKTRDKTKTPTNTASSLPTADKQAGTTIW